MPSKQVRMCGLLLEDYRSPTREQIVEVVRQIASLLGLTEKEFDDTLREVMRRQSGRMGGAS